MVSLCFPSLCSAKLIFNPEQSDFLAQLNPTLHRTLNLNTGLWVVSLYIVRASFIQKYITVQQNESQLHFGCIEI